MFSGYYAVVLGEGYGDEIEIQYFKEIGYGRKKNYVLADHNFYCREVSDLEKVVPIEIDGRGHFYF